MLSRTIKRALLERPLPPTFLLPWAAGLSTVSHTTEAGNVPPPLVDSATHISTERASLPQQTPLSQQQTPHQAPPLPSPQQTATPSISDSVRELLPVLQAQGPHYITIHIHGRPYLVTQGDTVRLSFLMKDAEVGDTLRLTRASIIGSREYTLKAAAPPPKLRSTTNTTVAVIDPTTGTLKSESRVMPEAGTEAAAAVGQGKAVAPHFIPHIAKGKVSYLDERLFVCRAVVMGVESEPMRFKEKTKRRQRKVKTVRSKHRYTVLRIKEVKVRSLEELENGEEEREDL
ncbi:aconitate hydratase [Teratosphaeria destructans]|uniref:Large ribosomal subunit protein bL21m n=1 Tax=Teratosphaeria destructans TaxID=418781 RepID=A0A9W7T390_9PEZI|nr:aconitate hydratase [Teratosphaeria destructans]